MTIWNDLLNLFFPKLCLLCKTPLVEGEEHICLHCLYQLPLTHYEKTDNNPTEQLFTGKIPIKRANSFLRYEKGSNVQKLIHSLKYKDNKELGYYLGKLAALKIQQSGIYKSVNLLVPVPLHPRKKRKRGYNQAEWIAKGIASILKIPVNADNLKRVHSTKTQTRKSVYERWTNVQNIFKVEQPEIFENQHVLLVDDVITSGSTMGACAQAIINNSITDISIFSLSIAER
ncbi:ComF family protein [Parabacteroides pacaensis]|uniref:ComF family protein n=1 Tax=Parabacteroides pacaensis TaxID=2086575 RepID=UPI000D0E5266|nr:phosphoribosyltransferase family protein [Parabacteroides pacaensis]